MAEERVKITVSYGGKEKRIPLAVTPALELSDEQVEYAEEDLLRIVRHVFQIPAGARIYLHETESGRIMSTESFRDPANLVAFPRHWYLAVEHAPSSYLEDTPQPPPPNSNGPLADLSDLLASSGHGSPDDDAELLPSLADLSPPDTHYQKVIVSCNELGQFGITLRHFSIQPDNLPGSSDGPDPMATFSLSSTFIYSVHSSGPASDSGLKQGDVVHMINSVSVITSGLEEIQDLLDQCGEELVLLVLPKERDDLQFLYPKYTNGEPGERATADGLVCVCDLTLHKGQLPDDKLWMKKKLLSPEDTTQSRDSPQPKLLASSPPTGLVPFSGSSNSLSCSNENMIVPQSCTDDILISGSLSEIPIATNGSPFKAEFGEGELGWGVPGVSSSGSQRMAEDYNPKLSPTWQTLFPSAMQNGEPQFPPEPTEGPAWYQESEDTFAEYSVLSLLGQDNTRSEELYSSVSDTNFLSNGRARKKATRTLSQSSIEGRSTLPRRLGGTPSSLSGRASLTSSTSALDRVPMEHMLVSLSQPSPGHCKSTDLGAIRLKKKGRKSLEALTRITVPEEPPQGLKRHRSDGIAHRVVRVSQFEQDPWAMESPAFRQTSSDTSQHSGSQPPTQLLSEQSPQDEPKALTEPARSESFRGKRQGKSYRSQREQLHKHKTSKGSLPETGVPGLRPRKKATKEGSRGRGWPPPPEERPADSKENRPLELLPNRLDKLEKLSPEAPKVLVPPQDSAVAPVKREHKSPPQRRRPVSAAEPSPLVQPASQADPRSSTLDGSGRQHRLTHSVEVPLQSETSRRIPIYHTRSAHTPYGQQVIREVPIDEAIRLSARGGSQRTFSVDSGVASGDFVPQRFNHQSGRHANELSIFHSKGHHSLAASDERLYPGKRSPTPERRTSAELVSAPSPIPIPLLKSSVVCHGFLSKKLDRDESGKRSHDRSWRQFYAVLSGGKLFFYKDKRDAVLNKPCDEPPLEVVPSSNETATNYTKKKFVFRVATVQGSEYLLQAEDHESIRRWVGHIQKLNGGKPSELSVPQQKEGGSKLSPRPQRRNSSPPPTRTKKREEGGLLDRLKKTLTRSKDSDEPDSSSFATFGQLLSVCPVSHENKRIPLVVEFCVKEVEERGLEVEGIYRKAGMSTTIKAMSAEMDKGVYSFDEDEDIHIIGSLLKKFLKELPDAVIPANMYEDFVACARDGEEQHRLERLKDLVYALPTAHYHTLKYLLVHLQKVTAHCEENKMNLLNVSTVFGPTLVRNPHPSAGLLMNDISAGNAVVEMLCQHVEFLFSPELCAEEVQEQQALADQAEPEPEPLEAHLHMTATDSASQDASVQKVEALAKASPLMVRRIKNDLSGSRTPESKHGSFSTEISVPLQPKQLNWESQNTETLKSNNSSSSSIQSPALRSPEPPVGSIPQHNYSRRVMVRAGEGTEEGGSHHGSDSSRTRSWVDNHSNLGWGREQKERRDRRRIAKTREQLFTSYPPPGEPVRELLTTSYASPGHESPTRFTTLPPSENRMGKSYSMQSRVRGSTLPAAPRRRVSYAAAIGDHFPDDVRSQDLPVREGRSRHQQDSSPEQYYRREPRDTRQFESSYPQSYASSYRRNAEDFRDESGGQEAMAKVPVYSYLQRSNSGRYHHHSPEGPDKLLPSNSFTAQLESYL